ncbi:MAG: 4-(cytidine 5'-diphospho)-2-C-methyl-D-erythritol kinase, partial [Pseudomonadota bacterium]
WDIKDISLHDIAKILGSDVPVCLLPHTPKRMQGIGDSIDPLTYQMPEMHMLLINPNIPCPTPAVYKALKLSSYTQPLNIPVTQRTEDFLGFLKNNTRNDMTEAAIGIVPEIADVLECLSEQNDCLLARLSGSGATCFGIFSNEKDCTTASKKISAKYPQWWVQSTIVKPIVF